MNKKYLIITSCLLLVGLFAGIWQYIETIKLDYASAVTVGVPNPGHAWSSMECSGSTLCVDTTNSRLGIGTNTPNAKLDVGVGASQCCATQTPNLSLAQASSTNGNMAWLQFHNSGEAEAYIRLAGGGSGDRAGARRLEIGDSQSVGTGLNVQGTITSTGGDVCNGSGKCLSTIYQTNVVIAGANATCPSGSGVAIMKANGGIWYTADASQVSSTWNKVYCGSQVTSDGTPLLVGNVHTQGQCTTAGGTVISDGTYNMCRFSGGCASGWSGYNNWSQTTAATSPDHRGNLSCCTCAGPCTTGAHSWSNTPIESCGWTSCGAGGGGIGCSCYSGNSQGANVIYRGCY